MPWHRIAAARSEYGSAPSPIPSVPLSCLPPPDAALRAAVAVPVRDEAARLPALVASLARQRRLDGRPLADGHAEVLLVLNNCTDGSAAVARALAARHPRLRLRVAEVTLPPARANVGTARGLAMDAAAARLRAVGRPGGLVLTTDADSCVAPDWIAATEAEVAAGADAVGGRICLLPRERAALPPSVRRSLVLDIGYRRALERVHALYVPAPHDPFPRHHQHYGASLAMTADAYAAAGGVPAVASNEDVGLARALVRSGARLRHSYRVRVWTSARTVGRAPAGMADALAAWAGQRGPAWVESADAAERRLAALGLLAHARPGDALPEALLVPAEPARERAPLPSVLRRLREIAARLEALSFSARLDRAVALHTAADARCLPTPAAGRSRPAPIPFATAA